VLTRIAQPSLDCGQRTCADFAKRAHLSEFIQISSRCSRTSLLYTRNNRHKCLGSYLKMFAKGRVQRIDSLRLRTHTFIRLRFSPCPPLTPPPPGLPTPSSCSWSRMCTRSTKRWTRRLAHGAHTRARERMLGVSADTRFCALLTEVQEHHLRAWQPVRTAHQSCCAEARGQNTRSIRMQTLERIGSLLIAVRMCALLCDRKLHLIRSSSRMRADRTCSSRSCMRS